MLGSAFDGDEIVIDNENELARCFAKMARGKEKIDEIFPVRGFKLEVASVDADGCLPDTTSTCKVNVEFPDAMVLGDWERLEGPVESTASMSDKFLLDEELAVVEPGKENKLDDKQTEINNKLDIPNHGHFMHESQSPLMSSVCKFVN